MRDKGRRLLNLKLLIARVWLAVEAYWPALWPAVAIPGFYTAVSLYDPWSDVPPWVRSLILLAVLAASAFTAFRSIRTLNMPDDKDARRRIEGASKLRHRPLDQADDKAAGIYAGSDDTSDPRTRALWQAHKNRSAISPGRLKIGTMRAGLQYKDPIAIRVLLVLLIFVGFAYAGPDWSRRISAAYTVDLAASIADVRLDAWLTPPGYTGVGAVTLALAGEAPDTGVRSASNFTVPEGTTLSVRIDGTFRRPRLKIGGQAVEMVAAETAGETGGVGADDIHTIETILLESGDIEISAGNVSRTWHISIVPDRPPSITFAETPDATLRHALRVRYTLNDDYGVEEAIFNITNASDNETDAITISVAGAQTGGEAVDRSTYQDLTAHPWAGMPVEGHLSAKDALGQTTHSGKINFVLPERPFRHPVARKLIAIRKDLLKSPAKREAPSRRLEQLARRPSAFDGDLAVFAALRSAFWRLRWNDDAESLRGVTSLLWDTALHLEEGEISIAETALRNLLEDAQRALADSQNGQNGQSGQDFAALADQISRLMQDYLAAQMERNGGVSEQQTDAGATQSIGGDMLSRMLQQMKDLAAAGRTEEAMELLDQLRGMLENASPRQMDAEAYKRMMEGARRLDEMEAISREQQELRERTARERMLDTMRKRLGDEAPSALPEMSGEQEALAQRLQDLSEAMEKNEPGEVPSTLGKAEQAMKQAAEALKKKDGGNAQAAQEEALNALKEAINEVGTKLSQQLVQLRQSSPGGDPLGRPTGTAQDRIDIPDQRDMEEARRLLIELRGRLSDPSRDSEEIEYLRRLLKRF